MLKSQADVTGNMLGVSGYSYIYTFVLCRDMLCIFGALCVAERRHMLLSVLSQTDCGSSANPLFLLCGIIVMHLCIPLLMLSACVGALM